MAVLRSALSACSNPRKKRTGSVSAMFTLTPPPEAMGFSSGTAFTLLIMLFADDLPDDQFESVSEGRNAPAALVTPPALIELFGAALISPGLHVRLSGIEVTELRLLFADRGDTMSVGSGLGAKCVSMKERKKRLALSLEPASFSVECDLLVVRRF